MTQTVKQADLRYITTLKNKPYIRVYIYRSSDDTRDYEVTTVHGRVSSCNTPATQPCYICKDAQRREDERKAQEQASREIMPLNGRGNKAFSLMR